MDRGPGYAGDMAADEAYALVESDPAAVLVDVRTRPEWSYVGVPDISQLGKEPIFLEWQLFPSMGVDPAFGQKLSEMLAARGTSVEAPILFICRSGARSRAAAEAMTERGYARCFNVAGGFEGPPDSSRHRGNLDGWKAKGLPWVQS